MSVSSFSAPHSGTTENLTDEQPSEVKIAKEIETEAQMSTSRPNPIFTDPHSGDTEYRRGEQPHEVSETTINIELDDMNQRGEEERNFDKIRNDAIEAILRHRHPDGDKLCTNPKCENPNAGLKFDKADIDNSRYIDNPQVECRTCQNVMSAACLNVDKAIFRRVSDITTLCKGDEIAWHRPACWFPPAIWHHAIVRKPPSQGDTSIKVMQYCVENICTVREKKACVTDVDIRKKDLFVVDYPESYRSEYVIFRAKYRVRNSKKYCFCIRNCEHYARWAKTGVEHSGQIGEFRDYLVRVAWALLYRILVLLVVSLLIQAVVPDDDSGRTIEAIISGVVGGAFAFLFILDAVRQHCLKTKDTCMERQCSKRYGSKEKQGNICCNNVGLFVRIVVEILVFVGLPMTGVVLFQYYYTGPRGSYIAIIGIISLGAIASYPVGLFAGRGFEQLLCCCKNANSCNVD